MPYKLTECELETLFPFIQDERMCSIANKIIDFWKKISKLTPDCEEIIFSNFIISVISW